GARALLGLGLSPAARAAALGGLLLLELGNLLRLLRLIVGRAVLVARAVLRLRDAILARVPGGFLGARVVAAELRVRIVLIRAGDAGLRLLRDVIGLVRHEFRVGVVFLFVVLDVLLDRDLVRQLELRRRRSRRLALQLEVDLLFRLWLFFGLRL